MGTSVDMEKFVGVEQAAGELRDSARAAASELGLFNWDRAVSLASVVSGIRKGRTSDKDITLFSSQGIGLLDVAVATHVYGQAKEQSRRLPLVRRYGR